MKKRTLILAAALAVLCFAATTAAETPVNQAAQLFEDGDFAGARTILEHELQGGEREPAAVYLLGRVRLAEEDLDDAVDLLKEAVKLDEEDSVYRTWLGRACIVKLQTVSFFEKGALAGCAQKQLKKAIELNPENVQARTFLANYYLNAPSIAGGSAKKALQQAEEIVKHDPVEGNALMAGIHARRDEYDQAIEKYGLCIDARPDNAEYRYRLAMLHQKLEHYDRTFEILEGLLEIDANETAALYQIGRTAVFSETNLDRGIECLRGYLAHEVEPGYPGYDAAHWRLGMLLEIKGDLETAREEFETALSINPDGEEYRKSLAALDRD